MTLLFRILYIYICIYVKINHGWVKMGVKQLGQQGRKGWYLDSFATLFLLSNPDKPNTTLLVPDAGLHIEIIKLCHFENFLS